MSYNKFFNLYLFDKAIDLAFKVAKIKLDKQIHGCNTWTYRHFIYEMDIYHCFGNFRVYWAYRWHEAELIDSKGHIPGNIDPRDAKPKDIVKSNYASRYE